MKSTVIMVQAVDIHITASSFELLCLSFLGFVLVQG